MKHSNKKTVKYLKELKKRPKSFFKFENGIGISYNRFRNQWSFDYETCGLEPILK